MISNEYEPGQRYKRAIETAERIEQACKEAKGETVSISLEDAITAMLHLQTMHYSENDIQFLRRWAKGYFALVKK